MVQPATGWLTCSICNASYDSETKLYDHRRVAHRNANWEAAGAHNHQPPDITSGRQVENTADKILVKKASA